MLYLLPRCHKSKNQLLLLPSHRSTRHCQTSHITGRLFSSSQLQPRQQKHRLGISFCYPVTFSSLCRRPFRRANKQQHIRNRLRGLTEKKSPRRPLNRGLQQTGTREIMVTSCAGRPRSHHTGGNGHRGCGRTYTHTHTAAKNVLLSGGGVLVSFVGTTNPGLWDIYICVSRWPGRRRAGHRRSPLFHCGQPRCPHRQAEVSVCVVRRHCFGINKIMAPKVNSRPMAGGKIRPTGRPYPDPRTRSKWDFYNIIYFTIGCMHLLRRPADGLRDQ